MGVTSAIFGYYPKSVRAYQNGSNLTVIFRYEDYDVTGLYTDGSFSCYYAMRMSENHARGNEFQVNADSPCFSIEFEEFYELLSGAPQKQSYKDFVAPVFVMNAIKRSLDGNCEAEVRSYEI